MDTANYFFKDDFSSSLLFVVALLGPLLCWPSTNQQWEGINVTEHGIVDRGGRGFS